MKEAMVERDKVKKEKCFPEYKKLRFVKKKKKKKKKVMRKAKQEQFQKCDNNKYIICVVCSRCVYERTSFYFYRSP